jgi:hypothetical protein
MLRQNENRKQFSDFSVTERLIEKGKLRPHRFVLHHCNDFWSTSKSKIRNANPICQNALTALSVFQNKKSFMKEPNFEGMSTYRDRRQSIQQHSKENFQKCFEASKKKKNSSETRGLL